MPQLCVASQFAFFVHFFSVFLFLSFSDIVENAQIPLCLSHKFGCTAYWAPHDLLPPVPFNSYLFLRPHLLFLLCRDHANGVFGVPRNIEYYARYWRDIILNICEWLENGRWNYSRVNRDHFIGVSLVSFPWVWCGWGYAGRGGVGLRGWGVGEGEV